MKEENIFLIYTIHDRIPDREKEVYLECFKVDLKFIGDIRKSFHSNNKGKMVCEDGKYT